MPPSTTAVSSGHLSLCVLGRRDAPICRGQEMRQCCQSMGPTSSAALASPGSVHSFTVGYQSSCASLGSFVHEGPWWLGHRGEREAPPSGKPAPTPASFLRTGQRTGNCSLRYSALCIVGTARGAPGESAPGPLFQGQHSNGSDVFPCDPVRPLNQISAWLQPHLLLTSFSKEDAAPTIVPCYFGTSVLKRAPSF